MKADNDVGEEPASEKIPFSPPCILGVVQMYEGGGSKYFKNAMLHQFQ